MKYEVRCTESCRLQAMCCKEAKGLKAKGRRLLWGCNRQHMNGLRIYYNSIHKSLQIVKLMYLK